jgi:hypothetical protein
MSAKGKIIGGEQEDTILEPTEVKITVCCGDNRLDAEKLGLLIKSRFAELQPPQIVAMVSLLTDLVSDLR